MVDTAINQGDIKVFLKRQVKDDVRQYRRELAIQRINLSKIIGVGNMEDYVKEWEQDFINSTTPAKPAEPKNKKLKKITSVKLGVKK